VRSHGRREDNPHGDEIAADDPPGPAPVGLGVEAGRRRERYAQRGDGADAVDGEDTDVLAHMAVGDQVEGATEVRQVVRIDGAVGLRIPAQGVVAHRESPSLSQRAMERIQVLPGTELELGAHGAGAHGRRHALDEIQRSRREQRPHLVERRSQARTERTGAGAIEQVAAHEQCDHRGQRERDGQAVEERPLDRPAPAPAVPLVVDRKAGVLEDAQVAPDRPDRASELAGPILDGQPLGPAEELKQAPLTGELVSPRHGRPQ
jgi:hypothetical protein